MTKNSTVLALKYRPQVFKDLIGQDVIAETIYNSIKFNKSANAYLFTGIRGVGKTTIARIVAKSLNCENGVDNLCKDNFCSHCESIVNSNHIDSQCEQKLSLHKLSTPFSQFNDFATILAIVVLPTPRIPVNK
jgi:replication-associated recombination protein RarA